MDVGSGYESLIDRELIEQLLIRALLNEAVEGSVELSLVITDDTEIQELNRFYRRIDAPTDVLSFSQSDGGATDEPFPVGGIQPLGDIVISGDRVRIQAEEYGHTVERELAYLAVHGLLHLLGHDHETPEQKAQMRSAEEAALGDIRR